MRYVLRFKLLCYAVMMAAALVCLQACQQEGSLPQSHDKNHGLEHSIPTNEAESSTLRQPSSQPTTPTTASASSSASAHTSTMPTEEQAAQSEATCRLANYVANENLSVEQASALSERVAEQTGRKMQVDASLGAGRAKNAALDDFGVPRYPECKVGGR